MTEETQPIRSLSEDLEDLMILRYRAQKREERRNEIPRDSRATWMKYQGLMSLQSYQNQPKRRHLTVQRLEGRLAQLWQESIDLLEEVEVDEEEFGEVTG
ncbi:hypothetical protein N7465_002889 [Penicillium sp. CMV-2018d]|nr:hypothetical protein N7465_002889 [Penicillium sp. CMV-2018d]